MCSIQIQGNFIKTDPPDVPHIKPQTTVQSLLTEICISEYYKMTVKKNGSFE